MNQSGGSWGNAVRLKSLAGCYGVRSFLQRHAGKNRAMLALGLNRNFPINQLQPLLHDHEAEPRSLQGLLGVEADAPIAHGERESSFGPPFSDTCR